ncbi:HPr family phosphocarrier protein [Hydrogenophilus thiooxidans]|uniref:HPr family phosphocarrier protein n=1 Tax=Hydrogenophilus thiooxidans TaxID=2820326 RepID=UPI001C219543|nr:HPr family phosphocarrier protein [Hydrogenophilus thiooxidans]
MPRTDIEVINKLGLHARASAKLAELANRFPCEIWLERNGRRVNAKSIMGILMLAAAKGTTVTVETQGEAADAALAAIIDLFQNRFGEPE